MSQRWNRWVFALVCLFLPGCQAAATEVLPTVAPTAIALATATPLPTATPTQSPTAISTPVPLPTATWTPSATPTNTPSPTATFTPSPTLSPTATETPTEVPTDTPTPTPTLRSSALTPLPAVGGGYLSQLRLVAYYGSPLGRGLGILGNSPRNEMFRDLRQLAGQYQALADDRIVVPTFHMVTTVADAWPGPADKYSHQVDLGVIANWVEYARANGAAVVLDIQPGLADLTEEFNRVREFLFNPHVHLAVDPEFMMEPGEVPGQQIGEITADEINWLQEQMNQIGGAIGVNRVLIVHQFEDEMIVNKAGIGSYPQVELLIDADGFGSPGTKMVDFWQYAAEPGHEYSGIKLFYEWDRPLMSPVEVMSLRPAAALIIYQ